jgi:hypothetical protein
MARAKEQPVSGNEVILAGHARLPENTKTVGTHEVLALVAWLNPDTERVVDASTTFGTVGEENQIKAISIGQLLIEDAERSLGWIRASHFRKAMTPILASSRDLVHSYQVVPQG